MWEGSAHCGESHPKKVVLDCIRKEAEQDNKQHSSMLHGLRLSSWLPVPALTFLGGRPWYGSVNEVNSSLCRLFLIIMLICVTENKPIFRVIALTLCHSLAPQETCSHWSSRYALNCKGLLSRHGQAESMYSWWSKCLTQLISLTSCLYCHHLFPTNLIRISGLTVRKWQSGGSPPLMDSESSQVWWHLWVHTCNPSTWEP